MHLEFANELHSIEKLREQELEEARTIQSVMLPGQPLRIDRVTISHEFLSTDEVGGDYLDYFQLPDGVIGLYVGDVSGKGLPAALYAVLAIGTLRGVHKTGRSPANVLSIMNHRLLRRGIPGRHTAIQYATFDASTLHIRIVSAGMPGPSSFVAKIARRFGSQASRPAFFRKRPTMSFFCNWSLAILCSSAPMV